MQREAMEIKGNRACIESQFVTVCLDHECMNLCVINDIPNCVHYSDADMLASDFTQADFWKISIKHHSLLNETLALHEVKSVCLFDGDVLIFDNPTNHFAIHDYDFQSQVEGGDGCDAAVNGGQLCFRTGEPARRFAEELTARKDKYLNGGMDQADMPDIARMVGASRCTLPKNKFAGHCDSSHDGAALYNNLVTVHTNCATGESKRQILRHVIDTMKIALTSNDKLTLDQGGI